MSATKIVGFAAVFLSAFFVATIFAYADTPLPDDCTGGNITHVGNTTIHTFTGGPATLTCATPRTATVIAIGGGGGGGAHNHEAACGGAGGGYSQSNINLVATTYNLSVGSGGIGGLSFTWNGGNGIDSWFDSPSTLLAKAGEGAGNGPCTNDNAKGGSAALGIGQIKHSGGNGGTTFDPGGIAGQGGGGGGGSGGNSADGGQGGPGLLGPTGGLPGVAGATNGGAGGRGGALQQGTPGQIPGGGGGGAGTTDQINNSSFLGREGASGIVIVSYPPATVISFQPQVPYPAPSNGNTVATGDFNGDGSPDMAISDSNAADRTISIYLNTGGTFQKTSTLILAQSQPLSVFTDDFNGDGKLDLLSFNGFPFTFAVFFGNGNGTFGTEVDYGDQTDILAVTTDINGDAKPDLITTTIFATAINVWLNDGNGAFNSSPIVLTQNSVGDIAVADVDADHKMDIVSAGDTGLFVRLGNGNGTFQTPVIYTTGEGPFRVTIADFNGDAKPDITAVINPNAQTGKLVILLGNGDGSFGAPVVFDTNENNLSSVRAADFDGDGRVDVASAVRFAPRVKIFPGEGDGTFGSTINFDVAGNPNTLNVLDLNADGKPDIVTGQTDSVSVLINNSSSGGGSPPPPPPPPPSAPPVFGIPSEFSFNTDLVQGVNGYDVFYLQVLLNLTNATALYSPADGCAWTGQSNNKPGSRGCETRAFGAITTEAVKRYQQSAGIPQTGTVGPTTRISLNTLLTNSLAARTALEPSLLAEQDRKDAVINTVLTPGFISAEGLGTLPAELVLGLINHESPLGFNNEFISFDWGRGVAQVTTDSLVAGNSDCASRLNSTYQCQHLYSNTLVGIQRNIIDGVKKLAASWQAIVNKNFQDRQTPAECSPTPTTVTAADLRYMSVLDRYNGISNQGKAIYKIWSGESVSTVINDLSQSNPGHGLLRAGFTDATWLTEVKNACVGTQTFVDCWRLLGQISKKGDLSQVNESLVTNFLYLTQIANNLGILTTTVDTQKWKNELTCVDKTKLITFIASPATLVIRDAFGNEEGIKNGQMVDNLPNAAVDPDTGVITMYVPPQNLKYEVVGKTNGTYDFVASRPGHDEEVIIREIPTSTSTIDTFSIDWNVISQGQKGITLQIDSNGDGITDKTNVIGNNYSDITSPNTLANVTGPVGKNGWYLGTTSVALQAFDNFDGVGVDKTFYSLDGGALQTYGSAIGIGAEGTHALQYYSVDFFGNQETTRTIQIKIDKKAPEAKVSVSTSTQDLFVEGVDTLPTTVTKDASGNYTVTDQAGHTLKLIFSKTFTGKVLTYAKLSALKYDTAATTTISASSFLYVWDIKKTPPTLVSQTIAVNDTYLVQALFDVSKNKTTTYVLMKGVPIQTQSFTGLRIPKLTTSSGVIGYQI